MLRFTTDNNETIFTINTDTTPVYAARETITDRLSTIDISAGDGLATLIRPNQSCNQSTESSIWFGGVEVRIDEDGNLIIPIDNNEFIEVNSGCASKKKIDFEMSDKIKTYIQEEYGLKINSLKDLYKILDGYQDYSIEKDLQNDLGCTQLEMMLILKNGIVDNNGKHHNVILSYNGHLQRYQISTTKTLELYNLYDLNKKFKIYKKEN